MKPIDVSPLAANEFQPPCPSFIEKMLGRITDEMRESLFQKGGISRCGRNITLGDLEVNKQHTRERFESFFEHHPNFLNTNLLSDSLHDAIHFLEEYLLIELPKGMKKSAEKDLKSTEDVYGFLHKTTAGRGGRGGYSPYYCALAKLTRTIMESRAESFETVAGESEYLYEKLFEIASPAGVYISKRNHQERDYDAVSFFVEEESDDRSETINTKASYRGKDFYRLLAKISHKPEIDALSAATDSLAIRFEVKKEEDVGTIVHSLLKMLQAGIATDDASSGLDVQSIVEVQNNGLNISSWDSLESEFGDSVGSFEQPKNPAKDAKFKALNITFKVDVPTGGEEGSTIRERTAEIQVVVSGNTNEKGMARHEIYEARQKLLIVARLFSSVSERYIEKIIEEAQEKTGFSYKGIRDNLFSDLVLIPTRKGNKRYIPRSLLERWIKVGFVNGEINDIPSGAELVLS